MATPQRPPDSTSHSFLKQALKIYGIKTIRQVMPFNFLGRNFSPGKSPPRRSVSLSSLRRETDKAGQDLSQDFSKIKLTIGGQNATFEDGEWVPEGGSRGRVSSREVARLRQQNQVLMEENNLLKLKVELLLDMLTEKSADTLIKEKELSRLKGR